MEQATRNFITLVNDSIEEAGDDLASFVVDGSDFTTQTDAMMLRFKKWVNRAWRDIQQESLDWEWMSEQAVVNITPGIMFYSPHLINWTVDEINPVTIYDVDGTAMISGLTASNLHNLTGIYTHLENFGYVDIQYPDYSFTNQHVLDFGMKAGGEYFVTTQLGLGHKLAFVGGNVWANNTASAPAVIPITGFPSSFGAPNDGTPIVNLLIVNADDTDGTPVATVTVPITGTARFSTGSPADTVAIIDVDSGDINDFAIAFRDAIINEDETYNLVGIYMEDDVGTLYGGLAKCLRSASGNWIYNVAPRWEQEVTTWGDTEDAGNISDFGGYVIEVGAVLAEAELENNFLTDTNATTFPIDGEITFVDTSGPNVVSVDVTVTNDLDGDDIAASTMFQISWLNLLTADDCGATLYETLGETSGINMSQIFSGDIGVTTNFIIETTPDISWLNYIHSWKSFDWSEELGDDDFVEEVREINQKSFRIISHDDPAISTELPLQFIPWEAFQNKFDFASMVPSMPRMISEDNTGRWRLYPPPNRPYTVLFDYVREPQTLVAATDVPKGLPEEYSDLIMWRAIAYFGEYDEQPSVANRAWKNYKTMLMKFEMQTREKFHFKSAYPWGSRVIGS